MTPAEWDDHVRTLDPRPLVKAAWGRASVRRRRLFLIALHLRGGYEPADPWEQHVLRIAERAASGHIGENHLRREAGQAYRQARVAAPRAGREARRLVAAARLIDPDLRAVALDHQPLCAPLRDVQPSGRTVDEWTRMTVDLVRCVFGDPTRPTKFDPDWRTATTTDLARAIDAGRAYHLLPVLADALQDAGCEDERVLGHCRHDATHARGCWVVDAVLGKG